MNAELDEMISDEELTALALASDPEMEIPHDAVPFGTMFATSAGTMLPAWYMPASVGLVTTGRRWKRIVALVVIAAFLLINAYGLCSTYGGITVA